MFKSKKIIIILLIFLLFSNCFILPISSTRCFPENYNYNEWHIDTWCEIYNVTKDMKVYGWTIIKINLTKPNVSNDIYFDIELPAKNDSVTYYYPNISGISLKREERKEGISVSFNLNRSVFMNCSSFEFAIKYTVREELFLNQKSQWFESLIRYRFETRVDILNDILLYKGTNQNSRIINIYIFLNDEATIVKPEKFSIVSKDEFPSLTDLLALNRTAIDNKVYGEIILSKMNLPKIEPNENNTLLISYIGSSSPGSIIFEFSFTNYTIVFLTFIAVLLGIFSSVVTIANFIKKRKKQRNNDPIEIKEKAVDESVSFKINTITSTNVNRVEKLDSLLLAVPSLFGIIGIIIPLFANAISEQGYGNIFVNEILYYFTIPLLFFAVFMPLYIGYWRGVIIANSITERVRGWIYLILGTAMYILPISLLFISIVLTLFFWNNIPLVIIINVSLPILVYYYGMKQVKKFRPFIKKLFNLYGQQEYSKKDEYFVFRTYLTVGSISIFFYILIYSLVLGKILNSGNIYYIPIRLIGLGVPVIYFGLREEKITSEYLNNIPNMNDFFLRKKIKQFFIILLTFSIFSIFFIIIDVIFNNLVFTFISHICIGVSMFSAFTMIMEKINLKYTEVLTEIENKSIDEIINIKGIGPKTIQHLKNGGITTIKKLEEIDIKDLMLIKRIRKKTARLLKESYNKIIFD